ncbi:MAG: hypothetical protein MJ075_04905 [Oscillospiraceae bacterium]|nr:hypothetical protein [Oscillospiraceae bacterium]
MNGRNPNIQLKSLVSCVKEKAEILEERIWIEIRKRLRGKAFREKNKHSKLVHPDVIRINRDAAPSEPEQPEPHWTEEELQEIERSLRAKAEEYAQSRSQAEQKT